MTEGVPRAAAAPRRWFARYENSIAPPLERLLLLLLAYLIGGLGYIGVNRLVGEGPFHHLALPLDDAIPFVPGFVFFYVLVYVTPAATAVFLRDRAELYRAFLAFALNSLVCFPVFLIFPVEYPRTFPLPGTLTGHLLAFVHTLDRPVNCFPSHHVSTAFSTFFAIRRQSASWGAIFGIVAALVALSTLFVKQHYLVDVPAGIAIACLTYWISFPPRTPADRG